MCLGDSGGCGVPALRGEEGNGEATVAGSASWRPFWPPSLRPGIPPLSVLWLLPAHSCIYASDCLVWGAKK